MASLRVPTVDFQTGRFPEVCALTGSLAESQFRLVAAGRPMVAGAIPLSAEAAAGLQKRKIIALVLSLVGLVCGALGVAFFSPLIIVGLISMAAGVLVTRRVANTITAKVIHDEVELDGVSEDFWRAVARPSKCAECPGKATCDVTAMLACDEHGDVVGAAHD